MVVKHSYLTIAKDVKKKKKKKENHLMLFYKYLDPCFCFSYSRTDVTVILLLTGLWCLVVGDFRDIVCHEGEF